MNIKKIIREELEKLNEKVLILSKDEMDILHKNKEIEKDGYVIRFEEGFGGELSKTEKKKFDKGRLENAEVLGYTLTGTKDIKESVNEVNSRNDKSIGTKHYKGVGWFWPMYPWKHYLRDTSNKGRTVVHNIWLTLGFEVKKNNRGIPYFDIKPSQRNKALKIVNAVEKRIPIKESVFAVNLDKEKNDERHPEQPNINYDPEKGKSRIRENKMIKLKNILKENKVWERNFGEPLPTLDSVMKKHQENKLNESPVSILKPARVERNSVVYGYINLKSHYNQIRKTWKELKSLLNKIDYVAIDFDDRDDLQAPYKLVGWKEEFIRDSMLMSFKKMNKFLSDPKNMKDPKRVQNAIKSSVNSSALPKWKQLTNLYKQYLKFNNKKVSSVFKQTKGKKVGERLIGDFGGFELTKDVHKLFTNQKGFTQRNVAGAFETMDSKLKHRYKKIEIRGQRD